MEHEYADDRFDRRKTRRRDGGRAPTDRLRQVPAVAPADAAQGRTGEARLLTLDAKNGLPIAVPVQVHLAVEEYGPFPASYRLAANRAPIAGSA